MIMRKSANLETRLARFIGLTILATSLYYAAACGIFDLMPKPKTTAEGIGLALTSITSTRIEVRNQLETSRINAEQAQQMQDILNQARAIADTATFALETQHEDDAIRYLDMATAVLDQLLEVLNERR
jgi:uncharacterized protein YkwD